jgi:Fe-S cluster biogenesis protein NfuA/nitrite reductase/ring-hydroxylating ferredoxin subunit
MSTNNGQHPDPPPLDDFNAQGQRIQELTERIEALPDPAARALMQECMQTVLGFYGHGLERILEVVHDAEMAGRPAFGALVDDPAVRGLLLIHGLHPLDLETRLRQALDKVRPYMESHGGNVELVSLENDYARLRLEGHCKTCPSSTVTLDLAVRQAIEDACPDLLGFEVEDAAQPAPVSHQPRSAPKWTEVGDLSQLQENVLLPTHSAGLPVIVCRLGEQIYAYRDRCPTCNTPLHLGALSGGVITCSEHHRYDARHAGRRLDGSNDYHLDPLPLLTQDGVIKVAVPA